MTAKLSQDDQDFISAYGVKLVNQYGHALERLQMLFKESDDVPTLVEAQNFLVQAQHAEAAKKLLEELNAHRNDRGSFKSSLDRLILEHARRGNAVAAFVFADVLSQLDKG